MAAAKALVTLSGGQDSTTALAWALERFELVETVGFSYGQRHIIEMDFRPEIRHRAASMSTKWNRRLGPDHVIDLDLTGQLSKEKIQTSGSQTRSSDSEFESGRRYIPGRNLMFISFAAAVAFRRGIGHVVCGVSEAEYSGYPDCREKSVLRVQDAIQASMDFDLIVDAPLMKLKKGEVWALAKAIGGDSFVSLIVEWTHTCYNGDRSIFHPWGYGCGHCNACKLRAKGWLDFTSPLLLADHP